MSTPAGSQAALTPAQLSQSLAAQQQQQTASPGQPTPGGSQRARYTLPVVFVLEPESLALASHYAAALIACVCLPCCYRVMSLSADGDVDDPTASCKHCTRPRTCVAPSLPLSQSPGDSLTLVYSSPSQAYVSPRARTCPLCPSGQQRTTRPTCTSPAPCLRSSRRTRPSPVLRLLVHLLAAHQAGPASGPRAQSETRSSLSTAASLRHAQRTGQASLRLVRRATSSSFPHRTSTTSMMKTRTMA